MRDRIQGADERGRGIISGHRTVCASVTQLQTTERGTEALDAGFVGYEPNGKMTCPGPHSSCAGRPKVLTLVLRLRSCRAGAPHVRDWVKRVMRSLSTIMSYSPPVNLPVTVAALGVIAKQAHGEDANGGADDDDSSDASSVYHPEGDGQHAALPPALAAAAAAMAAANTGAQQQQGQAQAQQAQVPLPAVESVGQRAADGVDADPTGLGVLGRPRAASNATSTSYLVRPCALLGRRRLTPFMVS